MGLFSFLNKNKQDPTDDDSGYVSRDDDDAIGARARSKRASSAGEPAARRAKGASAADPVLPEKKRARRRLVGAIALALAVAIGLPMILDSEPKPLAKDIDIRIPSKDQAPPQAQPAARPAAAPVAAADSVDKGEEIIEAPKPLPAVPRDVAEVKVAEARAAEVKAAPEPKPAVKPLEKPAEKPAVKAADKVAEKPAEKPPVKVAEKPAEKPPVKAAEKPAEKPPVKAADKPAAPKDADRALAILEDKPLPAAAPANQKYIVQVAALASQEKATELQGKLKENGIPAFTQKSGDLVRVRVGPFSKEEGEKIRARLVKLGLSGSVVPN